jgi:hypothetical protein
VMIEDKIDAPLQPEQANRYRQRGEQGIRDGGWGRFTTCLCAPESYLAEERSKEEWCSYISLESVSEWAKRSNDRHDAFLAAICEEAVAKRESLVSDKSPEATEFWKSYRLLARQLLPEVDITRLGPSVGLASPWPRFGAAALPANVLLEHKPQQGRVDLTFAKSTLEALRRRFPATLPFDVNFVKAGESAALRIAVPPVDHLRPFSGQEEQVLSALAAVDRLLAIGRQILATASGTSNAVMASQQLPQ